MVTAIKAIETNFKRYLLFSFSFLCVFDCFAQSTGVIEGYADVNNYGAATYTIPIKVPNGNNLIPDLSLHYNSQAGNGLLGMGFGITGLSVIEYDTKDIFS